MRFQTWFRQLSPILVAGAPLISTAIPISIAAHLIELVAVCGAVLALQGPIGIEVYFKHHRNTLPFVKIWMVATAIHFSLLWAIRVWCVSPVTVTYGEDSKLELGIQKEKLDAFEGNVPVAIIHSFQQEVNVSGKDIDDKYVKDVLTRALLFGGSLKSRNVHNNKIGAAGARHLFNAVAKNKSL